MKQLQVFNHQEFGALEVIHLNGKEMFNLENVAWSLGYTKVAKGKTYLRKDRIEKVIQKADISVIVHDGQPYITEDGLYELIFESETQKAKEFRKWVTSEVLPSIRKHGAYMTDQVLEQAVTNPDFMIGLLTNLKEEKEKRVEAERTLLQQQPLVTFAEAVQVSTNLITVKQLANLMRQKGIDTGQNRLFEWFRENGYLCRKRGSLYNTPTQYSMDLELFESQEYVRTNSVGEFVTSFTTKVTGKGQLYFINKFLGKEAV
ncbi:phage antirepressor [Bacillus wiedmannii]|uniref:phage antirepressor n=1 Tax=Bacillus wiedmannii TaxID=1890302 RepID=UPI000BF18A21|nr:phage antirepressor KilAC domain-containing protein [Bacillus wiedmannii]PEI77455.1 phage repressor protein/antirepressor Ant [Bacillus wiedmannii]